MVSIQKNGIFREEGMGMERYFNTEGVCDPQLHYMVRLDDRAEEIKRLFVDRGKYFVISRGRQYGKTTTLRALVKYLQRDYIVLSTDFQEIGTAEFKDEDSFARAFAEVLVKAFHGGETEISAKEFAMKPERMEKKEELTKPFAELAKKAGNVSLRELFNRISEFCGKVSMRVALIIDEVDSAANNQVFLDFLALLRRYYIDRENQPVFYSVILAGVYDIKNLKLKLRPEDERKYNSPWNIAAEFDMDMSFTAGQIGDMLQEYEKEKETGMDIELAAEEIYRYTSGYPYLVSAVCKLMDEKIPFGKGRGNGKPTWTKEEIGEAVRLLLKKNTPLFDSMAKQLDSYGVLRQMIEEILYQGKQISYSPIETATNLGVMFGFLKEENGCVAVANLIFEMALLNLFTVKEALESEAFRYGQRDKNQFVQNGRLNMDLVLKKFVEHFTDIYNGKDEKFVEKYGRKFFLLYLKPIINGTSNYYMEAQTRDARRTDVVVDYAGEQFVVEMKIWHGNEYNERGEEQLADYLDYFHLKKGYMISFNFNKKKEIGVREVAVGDKRLVEAVL